LDRSIVVTDAISAAGLGPGIYTLARNTVTMGEDGIARPQDASHLVGSTITMRASRDKLIAQLGLSESDASQLLYDNPLRAIAAARI